MQRHHTHHAITYKKVR